jgi:recombination protein RecA
MAAINKAVDKTTIIGKCLEDIKKKYPNSTLGVYKELGNKVATNVLTTGSISVDYAMNGGLARMSCLVGFPSSGKTTIALTAIAEYQKTHPDAVIIYCDAEFALDINYAVALGVDVSKMILLQPDTAEEGYGIIESFIESGICDIAVIDSVAAMIPSEITDGKYEDSVQIGRMATLTTKAVSRINRLSGKFGTHVIWINQYKKATSIGMFDIASPAQMGTNFYMPGGQQFPFYMQQIAQISRAGQLKQGKDIVSNVIKVKLTKNKVGVPYREAETVITFGVGLDKSAELVTLGIAQGVIKQSGANYTFSDEVGCPDRINGRLKLGKFLDENPDIAAKIDKILRDKLFSLADNGVDNKVKIDRGEDVTDDGIVDEVDIDGETVDEVTED